MCYYSNCDRNYHANYTFMIPFENVREHWDHDNLQSYEPEQVTSIKTGGWKLTAEPCENIFPDPWTQQQLRLKGKDPFYTHKSGRLMTDYIYGVPSSFRIICDIPQVKGVVPGFWWYRDPKNGVFEVDGFEATKCKFYMSVHDSWDQGHGMLFHKMLHRKMPKLNMIEVHFNMDNITWVVNKKVYIYKTDLGKFPYKMLLTLGVTEPIKKPVSWNVYEVTVR